MKVVDKSTENFISNGEDSLACGKKSFPCVGVCLYAVCFCLLGVLEQVANTQPNKNWLYGSRAMVGIIIGIIALSLKPFAAQKRLWKKYPFLYIPVCLSGCILAGAIGIILWPTQEFKAYFLLSVILIPMFSYILIMGISGRLEAMSDSKAVSAGSEKTCEDSKGAVAETTGEDSKKAARNSKLSHWIFIALAVFMLIYMAASKSEYLWPIAYLVMGIGLLVVGFSEKNLKELFLGLVIGLPASFIILQGWCCLHRPYDCVRYKGAFTNSNMNARYYLMVLTAVLGGTIKIFSTKCKAVFKMLSVLFIGAVLALLFMTIGRTAWFVAGIIILTSLIYFDVKKIFLNLGIIILSAAIMLVPCYALVRYIPPIRHNVVWLGGEYSENLVHSTDPWNSEKYVSLSELLNEALGRVTGLFAKSSDLDQGLDLNVIETDAVGDFPVAADDNYGFSKYVHNGLIDKAFAWEDLSDGDSPEDQNQGEAAADATPEIAIGTTPQTAYYDALPGSVETRKAIYSIYLSKLNMTGHGRTEGYFYLTPDFIVLHAHDIYIMTAYDFGIPAAVAFVILLIWTVVVHFKRAFMEKKTERSLRSMVVLGFLAVVGIYGALEYSWGICNLPMMMLMFAFVLVVLDKRTES